MRITNCFVYALGFSPLTYAMPYSFPRASCLPSHTSHPIFSIVIISLGKSLWRKPRWQWRNQSSVRELQGWDASYRKGSQEPSLAARQAEAVVVEGVPTHQSKTSRAGTVMFTGSAEVWWSSGKSTVTRQVHGQTRKTSPQASVRSGSMKDMVTHSHGCNISQAETKGKSLSLWRKDRLLLRLLKARQLRCPRWTRQPSPGRKRILTLALKKFKRTSEKT